MSVSSLAIAALLSYLSVVLLSKYEGFTLTLAGVAGLIVAIGITADSFVVYFERLRDEVREGRSLRAAVERGWTRARRTILVSDTVSFLAAALLYIFAIGDVKGFAYTLGLTTLIDVIVVFLFTKPMVTLLARTKFFGQGHKLSGLDPAAARGARPVARLPAPGPGQPRRSRQRVGREAPDQPRRRRDVPARQPRRTAVPRRGLVDFVGRRKIFYMISGLILLISVVALPIRGLNYSVDFKGGSLFEFSAPGGHEHRPTHRPDRHAGHRGVPRRQPDQHGDPPAGPGTEVAGPDRPGLVRDREQGPERADEGLPLTGPNAVTRTFVRLDLGQPDLPEGAGGADRVPDRDRDLPVHRVRVEDGRRGAGRAGARHRDHDRRLRADRLPGQPGHGHRPADHPGLLAVRHGGGVRQGPGEYRGPGRHPQVDLQPRRPTWP